MNIANIHDSKARFEILQTTKLSQTAVMTLAPGEKSSEDLNVHEKSDQILLVVDGEVEAEVGAKKAVLRQGDVCLIPAGTKHRITNPGQSPALTFNVYSPPEYPANVKD